MGLVLALKAASILVAGILFSVIALIAIDHTAKGKENNEKSKD